MGDEFSPNKNPFLSHETLVQASYSTFYGRYFRRTTLLVSKIQTITTRTCQLSYSEPAYTHPFHIPSMKRKFQPNIFLSRNIALWKGPLKECLSVR